jgi:hypothetical protein
VPACKSESGEALSSFVALRKIKRRNILNPTHLCCDFVKKNMYVAHRPISREVTMTAVAEILSTTVPSPDPRVCDLPTCPVCADSMVAAEASAYVADNVISYLWTCDTCGYGFVTKHSLKRLSTKFVCN